MLAEFLFAANLLAIAVFAASGGLLAAERRFDVVGAVFLSVAVGVGGGTLVDLFSGQLPVRWLKDPMPLAVSALSGAIVFFIAPWVERLTRALDWIDAVGLAIFTAGSLQPLLKAIKDPVAAGMLAVLGACGGGIIRDILANREPVVFRGELYVTAATAGVCAYYLARWLNAGPLAAFIACAAVIFVLRGAAMIFRLKLSRG